ncbi:PTS fructose transporter subunit IIC [Amedibacillus sp. YH-ame10]
MFKKLNIYKHLMSGVSYMLPFVVAGGMILSLAFLFDAPNAGTATFGTTNPISAWLLPVGNTAFSFMLPVLAGYISYSISNRPGLLPGMAVGALAASGGSGFIGAILGGFITGYILEYLKKMTKKLPTSFEGTKILIIYPLIGTLVAALIMLGINSVVTPINTMLTNFLQDLSGANIIVLGLLIGGMVAVDMGGPVNKTAYLFSVATLTAADGSSTASAVMACCACAGMTISTSCALATTLFPKKFNKDLKEAGKAAYVMGMSFIAEGAIPFVAAKPKAVLPSIVTGAAVAGGLTAAFGVTISAPIGGIFTVPLTSNIPLYLLAFLIGTLVSTLMIGFFAKEEPSLDEK